MPWGASHRTVVLVTVGSVYITCGVVRVECPQANKKPSVRKISTNYWHGPKFLPILIKSLGFFLQLSTTKVQPLSSDIWNNYIPMRSY